MERRSFLKGAGIGAVATAASLPMPAIAQSQPEITWRCTSSFPKSLDTIYGGAEVLSKAVAEMTDGKFKIQVFPGGEIAPALQALDVVQNGSVEMCHTCSYYYVGKDPTFAIGTAIPFGLNYRQQNAWIYEAGGQKVLDDFYAKYNIVSFPAGNTGVQMGGWWRKEIKSLADLQGVKMRIAGLAGQIMAKMGAVPQQIAGGDIYPSLEKGTIDSAEWVGPYDDKKLGFNQVAKFYYYPGWWESGPVIHAFINKDKFEALPKSYQAILTNASHKANEIMMAQYDVKNITALKELLGAGTQLRPFPRDVMDAAYKGAQELYADLSAKNPAWKTVYESMSSFQNDVVRWFGVAENGLDSYIATQIRRG